ncbi:hypothetical protein LNV08_01425 [Paucibacter sp. TC2R-5]|uniref:hypothetical protein n=1 Tax=Paucibacter sp. TC2R-5 TaxID=2893555 RepID=UPI0021E4920A|nr:hypothetical protein [Paucibacter sp. TC2R-5]MCV2357630.1 hypothetical protein [Paucibacter sp. TC2R-5]
MKGKLTVYQIELMKYLLAGSPAGSGAIDFDELLGLLSWAPTKAAAHFSLRALTRRGLIQKLPNLATRRGRQRVCLELTELGKQALDPRLTPSQEKSPSPEKSLLTPGVPFLEEADLAFSGLTPPGQGFLTPGVPSLEDEDFQPEEFIVEP